MSKVRKHRLKRSKMGRKCKDCLQNRALVTTLATVFVVANITVAVSYHQHTDNVSLSSFLKASFAFGDNADHYNLSDVGDVDQHGVGVRRKYEVMGIQRRSKVTNIGFLKVHKSGSSTISNILFRFGVRHNLTFALPRTGNRLEARELAIPLRRRGPHYNIIAVHTVFSETLYNSILPRDATKIAIVREPLQRAISAAFYYRDVFDSKYLMKIPRHKFIQMLIRYPERFERERSFSLTKNAMAKDFGFTENLTQANHTIMHEYLDYLNNTFSMVLIMEHFDESLVMLRRIMNWSVQDIVYLKANSYAHKETNLTENEIEKFHRTSFMDYMIYDYFTAEFQRKLGQQSNEYYAEVKRFKVVLEDVRTFCDSEIDSHIEVASTTWNDEFYVTRTDCKNMNRSVLGMISLMGKRHRYFRH